MVEQNIADSGYDKLQSSFKNTLRVFGKQVNYGDVESLFSGEKKLSTVLSEIMKELRIVKVQMII